MITLTSFIHYTLSYFLTGFYKLSVCVYLHTHIQLHNKAPVTCAEGRADVTING